MFNSVAFSPDGQHIVSGSGDRNKNNSFVECHDGRDSGRPFHWTHKTSPDARLRWTQDTPVRSCLWHSRQMASTSSRVQKMGQFVCGMSRRERRRQALSQDTNWVRSVAILARWPSHRLGFIRSDNSCVECHDGRDGGRPFHRTHRFGLVCGIQIGRAHV